MAFIRYGGLLKLVLVGVLLALFPSCSTERSDPESVTQYGTARMPLQASGSSGTLYRLENGFFAFTSTTEVITRFADPNLQLLEVDLQAGDYSVQLLDGWQLSRQLSGDTWTPVQANLASMNPVATTIGNQQVSDITFVFNAGGDQIPFGFGRARVSIAVNEMGSGLTCDLETFVPDTGCSIGDPAACVCVGCNDDGACGLDDDCYCSDCLGSTFCGCNNDGMCSTWAEGCDCGDCANHPSCPGGGCVDDGMCAGSENCACSDCVTSPTCGGTTCNQDGVCDAMVETCTCEDCSALPACGGTGMFTCDFTDPLNTVCGPDDSTCSCVGCVDDGLCDINDDCVCGECETDAFCASNCNDDGACSPFVEGCSCGDCVGHPLCP